MDVGLSGSSSFLNASSAPAGSADDVAAVDKQMRSIIIWMPGPHLT
jgi:hypothetical protein